MQNFSEINAKYEELVQKLQNAKAACGVKMQSTVVDSVQYKEYAKAIFSIDMVIKSTNLMKNQIESIKEIVSNADRMSV